MRMSLRGRVSGNGPAAAMGGDRRCAALTGRTGGSVSAAGSIGGEGLVKPKGKRGRKPPSRRTRSVDLVSVDGSGLRLRAVAAIRAVPAAWAAFVVGPGGEPVDEFVDGVGVLRRDRVRGGLPDGGRLPDDGFGRAGFQGERRGLPAGHDEAGRGG